MTTSPSEASATRAETIRAALDAAAAELAFDETAHRAWAADRELLRVTTVLTLVGVARAPFATDADRERGQRLHEAVAAYWRGDHRDTADPLVARLAQFAEACAVVPIAVECPVGSRAIGYAGRVDLVAFMGADAAPTIIDFKTGARPPWVLAQLAAYRYAVEQITGVRGWHLCVVELPGLAAPTGEESLAYRVTDLTADYYEGLRRFLAALIVAQWRLELGG